MRQLNRTFENILFKTHTFFPDSNSASQVLQESGPKDVARCEWSACVLRTLCFVLDTFEVLKSPVHACAWHCLLCNTGSPEHVSNSGCQRPRQSSYSVAEVIGIHRSNPTSISRHSGSEAPADPETIIPFSATRSARAPPIGGHNAGGPSSTYHDRRGLRD